MTTSARRTSQSSQKNREKLAAASQPKIEEPYGGKTQKQSDIIMLGILSGSGSNLNLG